MFASRTLDDCKPLHLALNVYFNTNLANTLVTGMPRPAGQHRNAVMAGAVPEVPVENKVLPAGPVHPRLEVVYPMPLRRAAEILEGPAMRHAPTPRALVRQRFRVDQAGVAQARNKDLNFLLPAVRQAKPQDLAGEVRHAPGSYSKRIATFKACPSEPRESKWQNWL